MSRAISKAFPLLPAPGFEVGEGAGAYVPC